MDVNFGVCDICENYDEYYDDYQEMLEHLKKEHPEHEDIPRIEKYFLIKEKMLEVLAEFGASIGGCGCCESPWLYFDGLRFGNVYLYPGEVD